MKTCLRVIINFGKILTIVEKLYPFEIFYNLHKGYDNLHKGYRETKLLEIKIIFQK